MKSALLYSYLIGGLLSTAASAGAIVSSDRFLLKILDRTISFQDINYQLRNLKALNCIYSDALVVQFFQKKFIQDLDVFIKKFPTSSEEEVRSYLHANEKMLRNIRYFFKILRYSEDQKSEVSSALSQIIKEGTKENRCETDILYKDTLKTNFKSLLELELYLRTRYGNQLKSTGNFETIKPSIELFVESLDKQFAHEYYW
ncbi:MAG TPA: hypothetical protein VNJ01_07110 [Bacteriovoracaceae bacterium]|nr:hypothetical protein [Bacteriovoracaceae bacterium]